MKKLLALSFATMVLLGCTGAAVRNIGVLPSLEPIEITNAKETAAEFMIYSGAATVPEEQTQSIPYWVMTNGKAKIEYIYFKPLYIVVN